MDFYLKKFCLCFVLIFLIVSCDSSGGSSDGGSGGGSDKIDDEYIAEEVLTGLHEEIRDEIVSSLASPGTYTDEIINGMSGVARLTGSKTNQHTATGSVVSDTAKHDFTIVFEDYKFFKLPADESSNSGFYQVTGTVDYYYYSSSTTTGSGYSSSYNIYLSGSNVSASDSYGDFSDTITFYSDDDNSQIKFNATLTPSSEISYSFKYWLW